MSIIEDAYQFHDNMIHGILFVTEDFDSELHLDIDYISDWPCPEDVTIGKPVFSIAKARLRFLDITDLVIDINRGKSGYTTAVSGICIDKIICEKIATPLRFDAYYKCVVSMTDERSEISFGASNMSLELVGEIHRVNRQHLVQSERV